ncbi:hypothetical protein BDV12DRAFT_175827 [Aspergillus spectabilis]
MNRDNAGNSNHNNTNGDEAMEIDTGTPDYYREFLRRLFAVISNNEPGAVDRLLAIIRSGASDQDIFRALLGLTTDDSCSKPTNRAL